MDKSPDAFRTISEVAETLETPAHVLRFWESRFPQIKPVKRAGGRRYYRPADVALLGGIRHLLHDEGMTIRGVQKILREQGIRHVASLAGGATLPEDDTDTLDEVIEAARAATRPEEAESAEILPMPAVARPPLPPGEAAGDVRQLYPQAEASPEAEDAEPAEEAATFARLTALLRDEEPAPPPAPPVEAEEVPEAGHVWVEDEPELDLSAPTSPAPAIPMPRRVVPQGAATAAPRVVPSRVTPTAPAGPPIEGLFEGLFAAESSGRVPLALSGLAARIRALPRPLSPEALMGLTELHSRLGLLHTQMAEALRMRR